MDATKTLTKADFTKVIEAIELIERLHPGSEVQIVPQKRVPNGKSDTPPKASGESTRPRVGGTGGGNRKIVAEATRGRWVTLAQIQEATGLTKTQIHGCLLGKDGAFKYERRPVDETIVNGPKEYRLAGT